MPKTIIVGRGRSKATQRIEITDPTVSREHCHLIDNGDGTFTLLNISKQGTIVEGKQVLKTKVNPNTLITLSPTTSVRVADLLPLPKQPPKQPNPPKPDDKAYDISHLEVVWDTYHNTLLDIQLRQRNVNLLRSASPMFTIGSGAIAGLAKSMEWGGAIFEVTIVLTIVGLGLMAYSFLKGLNDNSIQEKEEANDRFMRHYVCPNSECRHFLGNQPYKLILQHKKCPWCKSKFQA